MCCFARGPILAISLPCPLDNTWQLHLSSSFAEFICSRTGNFSVGFYSSNRKQNSIHRLLLMLQWCSTEINTLVIKDQSLLSSSEIIGRGLRIEQIVTLRQWPIKLEKLYFFLYTIDIPQYVPAMQNALSLNYFDAGGFFLLKHLQFGHLLLNFLTLMSS